jgi:CHRD domain
LAGLVVLLASLVLLGAPTPAGANDDHHGGVELRARLVGFQEVPTVSTEARGQFRAKINKDKTEIQFDLNYAGLEGTVTQGHIHFAQRGVNGGISVWLCQTDRTPPRRASPLSRRPVHSRGQ